MLTYSIAIRTLGTGGESYRRLLQSIARQSVQPDKVIVYIAEGYAVPDFRVGKEEYVAVPKGMVSQRALKYEEIDSDFILMLDDDVELDENSAKYLLEAITKNDADCVAADTFANHRMSRASKIKAMAAGLVFPSRNQSKAFRIRRCAAFSYLDNPDESAVYPSESAAGPAAMWRKLSFIKIRIGDEKWIENDGYAYGDDQVEFYKLHVNGMRLFVHFGAGVKHLDAGNSSGLFRQNMHRRMYVRTKNNFIIWWRTIYEPSPSALTAICFSGRALWNTLVALATLRPSLIAGYFKGLRDGIRFVRSDEYKQIPSYKLP